MGDSFLALGNSLPNLLERNLQEGLIFSAGFYKINRMSYATEILGEPHAEAFQQQLSFGYPPGTTVADLVQDHMRSMVHPHWENYPPVNPMWHIVLGCIYIFLFVLAFFGNGTVLYLYSKESSLHSPSNLLVVNLALSDFIMIITNFPFFAYNCFNGGTWSFSQSYCAMYAALGAVTGLASIWMLVFISYDRYNVIVNGVGGTPLTKGKAMAMALFSWGYALAWAIPPFVGWGKYMPEGILTSCSYDYLTRDFSTRSYGIAIFVFDYCIPMFIIVFSYVFIVKAIIDHEAAMKEQARKMKVDNLRSNQANAESAELRIAKVAMTNVAIWICCWTPYAYVSVKGLFGDQSSITPLKTMLPALLAKSCSTYNPMVYAINHPKFRAALNKHMSWFCVHEPEPKSIDDSKSDTTVTDEKPAA